MTYYYDKQTGKVCRGTVDAVYTSQGFQVLGEFPEMDQHSTRCMTVKNGKLVLDQTLAQKHEQAEQAKSDRLGVNARLMNALFDPSVKNFESERKKILGIA